jgi:hypothetical protein
LRPKVWLPHALCLSAVPLKRSARSIRRP